MLAISSTQFQCLAELRYEAFLTELRCFLTEHFPQHVQTMGIDALDALTRLSFSRASALGFDAKREHMIFAVYSVLFGAFFDEDPQYPWAIDRLSRPGLNPGQRIDLFRTRAEQAISQIEDSASPVLQLEVLAGINLATLSFWFVDINTPLIDWYSTLFSAQASWMRPRDLATLAQRAQALTAAFGLVSPWGEKLIIATMGMLGAGFVQDPQFHALAAVLSNPLPPAEKTKAFAETGRGFARDWLARTGGKA